MAVMFIGIWLTGCATHRQANDILVDTRTLKTDNARMRAAIARMDSVIAHSAEADNRLRAEMRTAISDLNNQIAALMQSNSELMIRINECCKEEIRVITASPGAQQSESGTVTRTDNETPSIDCSQTYDDAFILVRQLEYEKAINGFRNFLENCQQHENVPNAHYWIGESYYMLEKFTEAIAEFEVMVRDYKSSPNIDRALYKLARSHEELGHKEKAKKIYQEVVDDHPNTLSAEQARDRLKEL